jgi:hypothetical protein
MSQNNFKCYGYWYPACQMQTPCQCSRCWSEQLKEKSQEDNLETTN